MIAVPQPFIVREECEKAAFEKGFRRRLGEQDGWASFASTTAHGNIHLAASRIDSPWFLALDHAGVIAELGAPAAVMSGPGKARCAFAKLGELYAALDRVYALGVSLPNAPLREFEISVELAAHHRGRAHGRAADRPGHLPRRPDGVLAGPLPPDRHRRPAPSTSLAHRPVG